MNSDPIVILSGKRTPIGNMLGTLTALNAVELGNYAIAAAIQSAMIKPEQIDRVIMGCVLPAGLGQAPARQAAIAAKIPTSANALTINKMCGSGMQAIMLAHDQLQLNQAEFCVAGGMESMSNAPYLLAKGRQGYRLGHAQIYDHMMLDGLEDAYENLSMGVFAENTAKKFNFSREDQDEFAVASVMRAIDAQTEGMFSEEITPVTLKTKKGELIIASDQGPDTAKPDKIPQLKPAFAKDGTVTAANSSSISDGAAALILSRESIANRLGLKPIAKILTHSQHAQDPAWFTTAPIGAMQKVLEKTQWQIADVDLFEINEAFAVVTMAAMKELSIPHEKVNVFGGACVLGHPIGASGARIVVTLLNALKQRGLKKGIASLCIGGGEATAIAVELMA
ncbi:MAG: acetyl-CoA C-acyltransferase [Pseudomonadota bacterium]